MRSASMTSHLLAGVVILTLFPKPLPARDGHDWGNVQSLAVGARVIVKTRNGPRWLGDLAKVTADSLTVVVDDGGSRRRVEVARPEVREVRKKWSWFSSGLLGAGVGAGIAGGIGAGLEARNKTNEDRGVILTVLLVLGIPIGFTAGAHTNIGSTRVYVAP